MQHTKQIQRNFLEPGRVRVAVRVRPRNAEDLLSDADFADCVEVQPEVINLYCEFACLFVFFPVFEFVITYEIDLTTSLIMQLKKLKLRKNNWNSEFYKFDEVFAESASQKRVYETVAKPVVEVSGVVAATVG